MHYLVNKFKSCFPWSLHVYPVLWLYWVQIILQDYDSVGSLNDFKDWSFSLDLLTWPCDLTTNLWSINLNWFPKYFLYVLIDSFDYWSVDWLIWLLICWLIDRLICLLICWLIKYWSIFWFDKWSVNGFDYWFVDWFDY